MVFGLTLLAGGLAASVVTHRPALAVAGAVVLALALVPSIGRLLYIAWMAFGLTLGRVTTPLVLLAIYAVAIVPVAIVLKLVRRDAMRRRLEPESETYWEDHPRPKGPASYLRQF